MEILEILREAEDARTYTAGEFLFRTGELGTEMFLIVGGQLDVRVGDVIVERVHRGGLVGEMALIDQAPRSADAIAGEHLTVVPIDRNRFKHLVREYPEFALEVMHVIAERLRAMDRRFVDLSRSDVTITPA